MAVKYPFMQFYPSDWIADTRMLSLSARAVWLEIILAMHQHGRTGTLTGTTERLAGLVGCSAEEINLALEELNEAGTAEVTRDCNGVVTVVCRRMKAEHNERLRVAEEMRVTRMFRKYDSNVTPDISEYIFQKVLTDSDNKLSSSVTPEPENSGNPVKRKVEKIFFDYGGDCKIHGIDQPQLDRWKENFPAVDVKAELKKMSAWLDANRKNRKKDVKRFIVNWLSKTQDRAPRVQEEHEPVGTGDEEFRL